MREMLSCRARAQPDIERWLDRGSTLVNGWAERVGCAGPHG